MSRLNHHYGYIIHTISGYFLKVVTEKIELFDRVSPNGKLYLCHLDHACFLFYQKLSAMRVVFGISYLSYSTDTEGNTDINAMTGARILREGAPLRIPYKAAQTEVDRNVINPHKNIAGSWTVDVAGSVASTRVK